MRSGSSAARRHAVSAGLGLAMGFSNLLGYLVVLILTRTLGPADFGGFTALSTYGVLLAIPAGAFQVVVARRISGQRASDERTSALRAALGFGVLGMLVTIGAAPWLAAALHVRSAWSVVIVAAMVPTMTLTGCFQGILLGTHRLNRLSLLYLFSASTRLAGALVAGLYGFGVFGALAAMLAAAVLSAAFGAWLSAAELRLLPTGSRGLIREMVRSNRTLAAYVALTNVDILLARQFLDPHESGGYALASTFGRAMCWGTQFIALIIVPRMQGSDAQRTLLRASGLVLAIGLVAAAIIGIDADRWITLAGGSEFDGFGALALACVGLGIAWALAQLWLFSEMGADSSSLGILTWTVIAAQIAAIALWFHSSPEQIVAICLIGAIVVAGFGLVRTALRLRAADDLLPS